MELIQAGILATVTFTFLIVVSLRPIRKLAYEFFFFVHFAMVLCVHFLLLRTSLLTWVPLVFSSLVVTCTPRNLGK